MAEVVHGATRTVILVGNFAVKLPQVRYGWKNFLYGLLANMQERTFSRTGWPELCPVRFSLPGGWLVVMPRCEPVVEELTDVEFEAFSEHEDYVVPVEHKADSFGMYNGRLVAVDYGGK